MKKIYQKFIAMLMVICVVSSTILPTFVVYATEAEAEDEPGFIERAIDFVVGGEDKANLFERAVSTCFIYVAAQLYGIIGMAIGSADDGQPLTIESLFFNHYSSTRLTIFSGMEGGSNDYLDSGLRDKINEVYKFFTSIAVIAYMMMLIYIGIRILLNAGTAKNAKYKEFVLYWVIGVALLFLFPYVMKYTIVINNAFVSFIDTNKATIANLGDSVQHAGFAGDESSTLSDVSQLFNTTHDKLMSGTDYMSLMYQLAFEKGWLVYTLCFIIMIKQLLTLIITYFKRLLMTIFLIVIFPLVTVSYAIDKLGDGKSQAFGNWCKEYVLNVFIQSFHAIVYVIGMAMIFKLGDFGDNWLVLMMLITFISKGDELLRHIFNINGSGAGVVDDNKTRVKQTRGAVMLASKAGSVVSKKFGEKSHIGRATYWASNYIDSKRDSVLHDLNAERARDDLTVLRHDMADLNAAGTATDFAIIALDENSSELERNQALDRILAIMNKEDSEDKEKELNDLAAYFKDNPEALKDLENMLKVRAAQNAIAVGGLTPVELNEQIEIILKRMKGKGLAARMAAGLVTAHDLDKIRTAGKIKFRKPEQDDPLAGIKSKGSSKSGGTRKKGDRYSGTFRTPTAYRMQQARLKNQRGRVYKQLKTDVADSINPIKAGKEIFKGQYAKNTATRFKRVKSNATSVGDLNRRIKAAKKELRELERSGEKGSPAYRKIQENLNIWNKTVSKSNVRKRKSSAKIEQPGAVYNDSTGKIHENVERKKMAKKTKKTRDEVYEVAGVRDSFLKKQNLNKRNTLNTSFGRPGQSASKFKVHGVKYTGFKNARISGKNALNGGRTGVSLKRPQSVNKPDYATSSTPAPKTSTQTKRVAKERRQNANARNNYASQGNPLSKHSAIRAGRKEAQKELRDAQALMKRTQGDPVAFKAAQAREAEALKRLGEIQNASDRLNTKRSKKASEIRGKGITLNSNGLKGGKQYDGQMTKAEDTSVHVIKPQKTMKERSEAKALKRAVANEPEPVSIFADKFTEAMKRNDFGGPIHERGGTEKVRLLSSEVMELAAKKEKVEEPKASIKGMHSSATKDSTIASQRETVIVVRDGSGGYDGVTTGKNVISLSSKSDYEKAQKMVADVEKARASKVSVAGESSSGMTKEKIHETAMRLAASVTAINQSEYGDYTASEIVSHIDNIKAIMSSHRKGSEEYDVCLELVKKLQYDLSDFESSVRIQVLNDPTLIADSDPHRDRIMDSSIRHVKGMDDEDILLTMLRYDQDKLEEGKPLGIPKTSGYQTTARMASKGFGMGSDVDILRNAFEASLKEKELLRRAETEEKERDSSKAAMKKSVKNFVTEAPQAAVDLALNVPFSVAGGTMLGAMSSQTMQGAFSGALGGYSTVDGTIDKARGVAGTGINATVKLAKDITDIYKEKTKSSSDPDETKKKEKTKEDKPIISSKANLENKTSLGNGESLSERAKRMQNND